MDDYGCDELYDGDTVEIPVYNNLIFTVHVYDYLSRLITILTGSFSLIF